MARPDDPKPVKHPARPIVSFVRRGPRMNLSQQKALAKFADQFMVPVNRLDTETSVGPNQILDLPKIFGRKKELIVEIGSGTGVSLVQMAKARPEADFLAFEVYLPAIASTLRLIGEAQVTNIRLILADAVAGLQELIPAGQIAELWTFFPDPWRKKRHHKRRLIKKDFAQLVSEKLSVGGLWRIATDWDDYGEWIETEVGQVEQLINLTPGGGPRFSDRPITRFERRAIEAGRTVHDFTFVKKLRQEEQ